MTDLTIRTDRALLRARSRSVRYALVTIVAPVAERTRQRAPIDVAFVLDRSGSMGGEKIVLARDAVLQGIGMLGPTDRFAIVAYDTSVDVVMPLGLTTAVARRDADSRLQEIGPRGGTDLAAGWLAGCQQLAEASEARDTLKCLLMSDGQANHGLTDPEELERHATELRRRNIVTSTFGVGQDFDERLMSGMARAGGGNGYFIQRARQTGDMLTGELGESLEVVARQASMGLDLAPGVELQVLSDFDVRLQPGRVDVELGNLVSGQSISVIFRLEFPTGQEGERCSVKVGLSDVGGVMAGMTGEASWTWASHEDNDAQPRDRDVDAEVAGIYAARARREALGLNRQGDFAAARRRLEQVARKVDGYAGDSTRLRGIAASLRQQSDEFAAEMSVTSMKEHHYRAASMLRSRSVSGKARRARFDAEQFLLEMCAGVPVVTADGLRAALVTGSPSSFGRTPFRLLGDTYTLPSSLGAVSIESVERHLGTHLDVVLGTDILREYEWLLDVAGQRAVFSRGNLGLDGVSLRTPLANGVPSADVRVGGQSGRAYLDTGARLSYMDPGIVPAAHAVGRETDFFPLLGSFETDVYELEVEVAGFQFTGRFGVLPAALQPMLLRAGAQWVIGSAILGRAPLLFDLGHERVQIVETELAASMLVH